MMKLRLICFRNQRVYLPIIYQRNLIDNWWLS